MVVMMAMTMAVFVGMGMFMTMRMAMMMVVTAMATTINRRGPTGGFVGGSASQCQGLAQAVVDAAHGLGGPGDGRSQPGVNSGGLPFAIFLGVAIVVINPMLKKKTNFFGGFHGRSRDFGNICSGSNLFQADCIGEEIN